MHTVNTFLGTLDLDMFRLGSPRMCQVSYLSTFRSNNSLYEAKIRWNELLLSLEFLIIGTLEFCFCCIIFRLDKKK